MRNQILEIEEGEVLGPLMAGEHVAVSALDFDLRLDAFPGSFNDYTCTLISGSDRRPEQRRSSSLPRARRDTAHMSPLLRFRSSR